MNSPQEIPVWILLIVSILIVGVVTLIYSHGSWRVTLKFLVIAVLTVAFIGVTQNLHQYFNMHFVGSFDQLGIPFRQTKPGWGILIAAWPLWVLPALVAVVIGFLSAWFWRQLFPAATKGKEGAAVARTKKVEILAAVQPLQTMGHALEVEALKQTLTTVQEKLAHAAELYAEQVDRNQDLMIEIEQLLAEQNEKRVETHTDLEDKVLALEIQLAVQITENQQLSLDLLEKTDELARLREKEPDEEEPE